MKPQQGTRRDLVPARLSAAVSVERSMRRIVVVLVVGIFFGLGYALWQYCGTGKSWNCGDGDVERERGGAEAAIVTPEDVPSGKSLSDEQSKVIDSGVTPDPKASDAAEAKKSAVREKIASGKETRGLVANLRALTATVKPGEPIEFEIRVKNVTNKDILVTSSGEKLSACFWTFYFDQWEWLPAQDSCRVLPMKAGETVSVRCLVATTRESMTAEQERKLLLATPFHHMQNKNATDHLPEGSYRVHAVLGRLGVGDPLQSNTIEVRIIDRR
jgi:hypothetical protein